MRGEPFLTSREKNVTTNGNAAEPALPGTPSSEARPRSFAETALAGEDERRRADTFARPARVKFWRHAALFVVANVALAAANAALLPGQWVFYYLTIVWAFVLADNFLWAYVVDPDRDVAERAARRAERARQRSATRSAAPETSREGQVSDDT